MAYLTTSMATALNRIQAPERAMSTRTTKLLEHTSSTTASEHQTAAHVNAGVSPSSGYTGKSSHAPPPAAPSQYEQMAAVQALVEHYRTRGSPAGEVSGSGNRGFERAKPGELLQVTLQTREGDTITLSISAEYLAQEDASQGPPELATRFSFSVEGNLSDDEREAADALMARLGDVAKDYQKDDWAQVDFLNAFDSRVIAQIDLRVQGNNDNALTVDYQAMPDGSHSLAVNQNGYQYSLSRDSIMATTGFAAKGNLLYQQYAQLITDATRSYQSGDFAGGVSSAKAVNFFLNGLAAIFNVTHSNNVDSEKLGERGRASLNHGAVSDSEHSRQSPLAQGFLSDLPDFTASFNTPRFTPNASNRGEVSQMTLSLAQHTSYSFNSYSGIKSYVQQHSSTSRVSQHFAVDGGDVRFANLGDVDQPGGQTYQYSIVEQALALSRQLSVDRDGELLNYGESKQSEHTEKLKTVVNGNIESQTQRDLSLPKNNYAFELSVPKSPEALAVHKAQLQNYSTIKMLEASVKTQNIDFYS
ncbi:MAG TPA: hypothetical protein VIC26_02445 [Marinagarivorans sp.]